MSRHLGLVLLENTAPARLAGPGSPTPSGAV